jgi:cytochrome c peroxidase
MKIVDFAKNCLPRWLLGSIAVSIAIASVYLHSWTPVATGAEDSSDIAPLQWTEPIQPIQALPNLDPRKIALGQKLFSDPELSHNNQISCATCHALAHSGADGRVRSDGIYGAVGVINAPTVFNSGFNFRQFWDGRAATLEAQIDGPIQSNIEMGSNWPEVVAKLSSSRDYVRAFRRIYRDGIRSGNVKDSIAEFERSLTTPNSRFDRYLRHDNNALTRGELEGYRVFKSFGCASCHQGVGVGGNLYQKMGVVVPYFVAGSQISRADRGRFNVTGDPRDLYMFKVPSLRNVELTAPYFHNGSAATLADAVRTMAKYQLGRPLDQQQVELIVAFLKTLTGERNGKPL